MSSSVVDSLRRTRLVVLSGWISELLGGLRSSERLELGSCVVAAWRLSGSLALDCIVSCL